MTGYVFTGARARKVPHQGRAVYPVPMDTPFMIGAYLEAVHTQMSSVLVDCRDFVHLCTKTKQARSTMLRALEDLFTIYHLPFTPYSLTPSIQHLLPRQYSEYCEGVHYAAVDPTSFERFADMKVLRPMRVFLDQLQDLMVQVSDANPMQSDEDTVAYSEHRNRHGQPPLPSDGAPAIATWVCRTITKIIHRFLKLSVVQCTHAAASWTRDTLSFPLSARVATATTAESPVANVSFSSHSSTGSTSSYISAVECAGESYTPDAGLCRLQMAMTATSSSFDRVLHLCCSVVRSMMQLTQDAVNSNLDDMRPVMTTIDKVHRSVSNFLYADYSWFFLDVEHRLVTPLQQLNKKRSLLDRVTGRFASKKAASPPSSPTNRPNVSPLSPSFLMSLDTSSAVSRVSSPTGGAPSLVKGGHETHLERQQRILREVDTALSDIAVQYLRAFGSCFFMDEPRGVRGRKVAG